MFTRVLKGVRPINHKSLSHDKAMFFGAGVGSSTDSQGRSYASGLIRTGALLLVGGSVRNCRLTLDVGCEISLCQEVFRLLSIWPAC